jgi:hypothetical protein
VICQQTVALTSERGLQFYHLPRIASTKGYSIMSLPASLLDRLGDFARRVRRLHALRGASLLVLTLSLVAGLAFLTDYLTRHALPGSVRGGLLVVWCLLAGVLAWRLVRLLIQPLDPAHLAAVIEEKYPELDERLTSSVELAQHADAGSGSPALVALLLQETQTRTQPLDLGAAISPRATVVLTGAAVLALVTTITPAAVAPDAYGQVAQRFFLPWYTPAPRPDFTISVEPGDRFAARGRPLTITAHLSPRRDSIPLPQTCSLRVVAADGSTIRHPMTADPKDASSYSTTFRLTGDLHYTVEAGNATSERYSITSILPVDLAADSPAITLTPPAYAAGVVDPESIVGLVDLTTLQHGQVALRLRFNRPAVSARLEWTPSSDKKEGEKAQSIPLTLSSDQLGADYALTARHSGSFRLILEAEHGVLTERDGLALTVRPDQPPAVVKFVGQEGPRSARAYDRLPLEIHLADDIAVAGADLEYRVNTDKTIHEERIQLEGAGSREGIARHVLLLAGKVKSGDEVHYRIRYRDNLPREFAGPHVCYYPADNWMTLRIVAEGGSLREQEILARRDAINKKLDEIKAELKQEQRRTINVRTDAQGEEKVSEKTAEALAALRQQNQSTERALRELAREVSEEPAGEKLAELARNVAQNEMHKADEGLREASQKTARPEQRDRNLQKTEEELNRALARLDKMRAANEQMARDRLDQAKVEELADRQRQLSEKAAELANKHPVQDPEAKKLADELRKEQDAVAQELARLTEQSQALQKALEEARAEQSRQAAEKARQLAQAQRDLTRASDETEKKRESANLNDLARKQQELARKANELAKQTERPAKANFSRPLQTEDTTRAADSLARGETEKARQEQDRSAREMERLANDLERGAKEANDARAQARQLARLEEDLAKRARAELKAGDDKKRNELKREQEAIRQAAEKLSVPASNKEAQSAKRQATEELTRAEKALAEKNTKEALTQMDKARQSLRDLANKIPEGQKSPPTPDKESVLPTRAQAEAARKLAQEQRDLRQETKRATEKMQAERRADSTSKDNPAGKLAREQSNIAREAAQLARNVGKEQGAKANPSQRASQANQSASETSRNLDAGALDRAMKSGQKTADELRRLADELARTPRGATPDKSDTLQQARQLAQRQEAVNKQLQPLASNTSAQRAQQQARQEELTRRTGDLMRELEELGRTGPSSQAQASVREAAQSANQANQSMQAARNQSQQGNQSAAQIQRDLAARNLEQAARQAERADQLSPRASSQPGTGQSVREARGQMRQAQAQMNRNQPGQAGQSMRDATQNLERAAEGLAQAMQPTDRPGNPTERGSPGGGIPDASTLPGELAPHAGKKWGELPGELRTKIVQQMKARYGEDYARMIKLYFEQIADTKKRR